MKKRYNFWLGIIISIFFFYLFLAGTDFRQMWEATKEANYIFILLCALINTFVFLIRAKRWEYFMEPIKRIRLGSLFSAVCIGFMGNSLLPARAGEFIRAYVIGRREGVSKTSSFATIVLERLFDGLTLLIMLILVVLFFPFPSEDYGSMITINYLRLAVLFTSLFYLLVIIIIILLSWKPKRVWQVLEKTVFRLFPAGLVLRLEELYRSFVFGLESLKRGRHVISISVYSVFLWLVTAFGIYLLFPAFSISPNFFAAILVMAVVAVVVMLPSSPGYIGTFHWASSQILIMIGVGASKAKSFAILHHACCIIPVIILGIIYLSREHLSFGEIKSRIDNERADSSSLPPHLGDSPDLSLDKEPLETGRR